MPICHLPPTQPHARTQPTPLSSHALYPLPHLHLHRHRLSISPAPATPIRPPRRRSLAPPLAGAAPPLFPWSIRYRRPHLAPPIAPPRVNPSRPASTTNLGLTPKKEAVDWRLRRELLRWRDGEAHPQPQQQGGRGRGRVLPRVRRRARDVGLRGGAGPGGVRDAALPARAAPVRDHGRAPPRHVRGGAPRTHSALRGVRDVETVATLTRGCGGDCAMTSTRGCGGNDTDIDRGCGGDDIDTGLLQRRQQRHRRYQRGCTNKISSMR